MNTICSCKKLWVGMRDKKEIYFHQATCPDFDGNDADVLRKRLNGVEIGTNADMALDLLGKSMKRENLGIDPQYKDDPNPNYTNSLIVRWDYPGFSLIFARGVANTRWGKISAYCVQKIETNDLEIKKGKKPFRSKKHGKRAANSTAGR